MYCSQCGTKAVDGAFFCQTCGAELPIDTETATDQLDVMLTETGTNKVSVIKMVRELTGLGLKESKELVDHTPILLKKGVTQAEAKSIKEKLIKVGATVTITDQEGSCVDIILHCKACGAVLEDGSDTCKSCGRVFAAPPEQDGVDIADLLDSDVRTELLEKFKTMPVVGKLITVLGALFAVCLVIVLLRLILSSLAAIIITAAGGYFVYYRWGAKYITERKYLKRIRELQLPDGISPQTLLETLSGKFNYPYFKGVRYGENGDCVIDGRYSAYTIAIYDNDTATLSADLNVDENMKRTVMLEGIAICSYINKFFTPSSAVDVVKDVKALKMAERQRKTIGLVITVASILVIAVFALEYALPGSLQRIAVPGAEVRGAYLTQYSETVTVEEAFENFFDKPKWSTYKAEGYSYVVFTGACEFIGEKADVRITFEITGEQFHVDNLDLNGQEQGDLMLYSLLSKVYEDYEEE